MLAHDVATAAVIRDNELESAKLTARHWRYWGWGLGVLLGLSTLGNIYQGTQHRWIIRYVEVDKASQQARVIEPAAERYEPSQAIVKGVLSSAVKTLRGVSKDRQEMAERWDALKVCLTPGGRQRLRDYEAMPDAPGQQTLPRVPQIITLLPRTPRTYDVRWQEWRYDAHDRQEGPARFYSATLTFERRDPRTEQELALCPTGIFLDTWTLGKEQ